VKELRRALALSKEESTILESERQRLMKENVVLTRGKHIKEFAVGGVVGRMRGDYSFNFSNVVFFSLFSFAIFALASPQQWEKWIGWYMGKRKIQLNWH
jgi:hypothetical protein